MFGYIRTDVPNLYMKDNVLYKSLYCGMCKNIRKACGANAKFALTYDIAFFSALFHNVCGTDVEITKQHCIAHPFTKRPMAGTDELGLTLGAFNTLLAYYKILDNVEDENRGRAAKTLFKGAYKKAKKREPQLDSIIKNYIGRLHEIEKAKTESVDIAADSFGCMTRDCAKVITKDKYSEDLGELCYLVGKWIYILDAADDFDKDKKKGSFNPFVYEYKDCKDFSELIEKHSEDVRFAFSSTESAMADRLNNIKFVFNSDLIENIILRGMPLKSKGVLQKECVKCKKITKS